MNNPINTNNIPTEYKKLVDEVKNRIESKPEIDGAFAVLTKNGEVFCTNAYSDPDTRMSAEEELISTLKEKGISALERSVFIWKNGTFDVMSGSLLKALIVLNPENKNAMHIVKGVKFFEKKYDDLIPMLIS